MGLSGVGRWESFLFPSTTEPQKFLAVRVGRLIALPLHNSGGACLARWGSAQALSFKPLKGPEHSRQVVPLKTPSPVEHATPARDQSGSDQRPLMAARHLHDGIPPPIMMSFQFRCAVPLRGLSRSQLSDTECSFFRVWSRGRLDLSSKPFVQPPSTSGFTMGREISFPTVYPGPRYLSFMD